MDTFSLFPTLNQIKRLSELEEYFYLNGVTVVEWCDIIEDIIPDDFIRLDFKITDLNKREITITEYGNVNILNNLKQQLEENNYEIICGQFQ